MSLTCKIYVLVRKVVTIKVTRAGNAESGIQYDAILKTILVGGAGMPRRVEEPQTQSGAVVVPM